jgi:hypothetical protein
MTPPGIAAQRFLHSLMLGGVLGCWYGFLRPLGRMHPVLRDGLFVPGMLTAWLILGFGICEGDLRIGYLAGLLIGCAIWELTAGILLRPLFSWFWKLFGAVWGLFLWPVKKFLYFVKIFYLLFSL